MLRKERDNRGIPLWKFAASVPFPASNMQRIEVGITEPRIGVAMKMLAALYVNAGAFMQTLAEAQDWQKHEISGDGAVEKIEIVAQNMLTEEGLLTHNPKAMFGLFFRRVRVACNITQAVIAERANYTVRSIIALEGCKQEPMVMRALQLACATGISVKDFFGSYAKLLTNISPKQ